MIMKNRYINIGALMLLVFVAMSFSSCHLTKKYQSPEVSVDEDELFRFGYEEDSTTIATLSWRDYYSDPILQGYIEEALEDNHDMLVAEQRIRQAEAVLGQARSEYFPDVALSGQVEQVRLSNANPNTGQPRERNVLGYHTENYSLGIVASWELDIWGKMRRKSKASYADMLNSYAGKQLIQTSLISNIANNYYALMALDAQLVVTNVMIGLMEENLIVTEALRDAGMATGAAVEQTRALLHSTKATVPDLESNISRLENAFSLMLGREPGDIERSPLSEQKVRTDIAYGVPAQMLALRPDVTQAELAFRSAFELTNVARASMYPSIQLTSGMFGFSTTNGLSNFFKPENLIASIAGGLTQPLFARKQLKTQLELAKADQQIAYITFEQSVLNAGREVSDIMTDYQSALSKKDNRDREVEARFKAVEFSQELLAAGEATYLEVLSAQQGLLQAQLSSVSDRYAVLESTSNLYRALGGGVH